MILVIETSAEICSVALCGTDGKLHDQQRSEIPNAHAERLPLMVKEILERNGAKAYELDAIAVSWGPGSYTGLRIGTSLAKGICYASGIPLISVNGLLGLAWKASQVSGAADIYLSNLDARRDEFYMETWNSDLSPRNALAAEIATPDFLSHFGNTTLAICGNASKKIEQLCEHSSNISFFQIEPEAGFMVEEAARKFRNDQFEDVAYFEPRYLKEFVPGISKKFGL